MKARIIGLLLLSLVMAAPTLVQGRSRDRSRGVKEDSSAKTAEARGKMHEQRRVAFAEKGTQQQRKSQEPRSLTRQGSRQPSEERSARFGEGSRAAKEAVGSKAMKISKPGSESAGGEILLARNRSAGNREGSSYRRGNSKIGSRPAGTTEAKSRHFGRSGSASETKGKAEVVSRHSGGSRTSSGSVDRSVARVDGGGQSRSAWRYGGIGTITSRPVSRARIGLPRSSPRVTVHSGGKSRVSSRHTGRSVVGLHYGRSTRGRVQHGSKSSVGLHYSSSGGLGLYYRYGSGGHGGYGRGRILNHSRPYRRSHHGHHGTIFLHGGIGFGYPFYSYYPYYPYYSSYYYRYPFSPVYIYKSSPPIVVKESVVDQHSPYGTRQGQLTDEVLRGEADKRREAAEGLAEYENEAAMAVLIDALINDADPGVRAAAAASLGKIGDSKVYEALLRSAEVDPDEKVQEAARESANGIKEAVGDRELSVSSVFPPMNQGKPELAEYLEDIRFGTASTREEAVKKLAKHEGTQAVAALINTLINDPEGDVREEAAESLGIIGDRIALPFLKLASDGDGDKSVRKQAEKAVKKIHGD